MTAPASAPTVTGWAVHWSRQDRFPRLTVLLGAGVLGAIALAMLGLPPIDLHEPTHRLGIMSPSCGITRAVRWLARGDRSRAWRFNPGSFLLAAAGFAIAVRTAFGRLTGRWLEVHVRGQRLVTATVVGALALLWLNQQHHAALLMSAR